VEVGGGGSGEAGETLGAVWVSPASPEMHLRKMKLSIGMNYPSNTMIVEGSRRRRFNVKRPQMADQSIDLKSHL
jgi:hypothetical protein